MIDVRPSASHTTGAVPAPTHHELARARLHPL